MQWFDVNMSGCEQGPGDPCFFDDDPVRVYMASEVEAHISELESAAVASALRVMELEKAMQEIRNEAGSHTVNLKLKAQPGAGHVYIYDIANRALMER